MLRATPAFATFLRVRALVSVAMLSLLIPSPSWGRVRERVMLLQKFQRNRTLSPALPHDGGGS
jgi:hypothetical protein